MTATAGQQFTAAIRTYFHIGPRTRWYRRTNWQPRQDLRAEIVEAVMTAATQSGYYTPEQDAAFRLAFTVVCGWNKHVEGYRLPGEFIATLRALTPWQWTAWLGRLIDDGISNVFEMELWLSKHRAEFRTAA